jgi:uncharacterized repeat protein (TIGR01451 family)
MKRSLEIFARSFYILVMLVTAVVPSAVVLAAPQRSAAMAEPAKSPEKATGQHQWNLLNNFGRLFSGLGTKPEQSTGCTTSGDLVITNGITCSYAAGTYTFNTIIVQSGGILRLTSQDNGDTDYTNDIGVTLNADSLTVENNGLISADGVGYAGGTWIGKGPGGGNGQSAYDFSGGGGGYGGLGGNGYFSGGVAYGSVKQPVDLGSAGGGGSYYGLHPGGNGGGAIRLVINGTMTVNGVLSANGAAGSVNGGGGSGGSLWLTTGSLTGNGVIRANGGGPSGGGGGAGGRIALYYDISTFPLDTTHLQVLGSSSGGPGTVFILETGADSNGILQLNNQLGGVTQPVVLYGTSGGSVTFDQVIVGNNTILRLVPYNNGNTIYTDDSAFVLNANSIVIHNGGSITTDGMGYTGGDWIGSGPGGGKGQPYYDFSGGGGGYGGPGANGAFPGGAAYGSLTQPTDLGSAGGAGSYYGLRPGGSGGGAIRLVINGTMTVNGVLSANGAAGSVNGGGGSGGSLWLTTGSLAGSGIIRANGGSHGSSGGGNGAGGRIALYYRGTILSTLTIQANGGTVYTEIITEEPVDPQHSTIIVSPETISANGIQTSTVFVTLRDAQDNPIWGHQVVLTHNGTNLTIRPVLGWSNDQGQVAFTLSSSTVQTVNLQANDQTAGVTLAAAPTLEFLATDPDQSTVSVTPSALTADGISEAAISVMLKDSTGNIIVGKLVELLISGTDNSLDGQSVGPAKIAIGNTDEYGSINTHLSSTHAETKTIQAFGQGIVLAQPAQVVFAPGAASATVSIFSITPLTIPANGQQSAAVTLLLKDAQGNPIPGHEIGLMVSGNPVQIELPVPALTDSNGTITGAITSTTLGETTITARDLTGDVTIGQPIEIQFIAGPTDREASSVEVQGENLVANGSDTATIRVLLMDRLGHPISGHVVSLAASGSGNLISEPIPATTGSDGRVRFTLKSTGVGNKTLTVRDTTQNVILNDSPVVNFSAGPISLQNSRLETDTNVVAANGEAFATITVTTRDAFDNPIQGVPVEILADKHAVVTQPADPTDENGQAIGQVRDATLERVTVTAKANGAAIPGGLSLDFKGSDLVASLTGTAQAAPEGAVSYRVMVRNSGNLPANEVALKLTLPAGLTLSGQTAPSQPTQSGSDLFWELGTLQTGGQIGFDVITAVDGSAAPGSALETRLDVTTTSLEMDLANNLASATTSVIPAFSFTTALTPSGATLNLGGSTSYNLHVVNTGQKVDTFSFSVSGLDSGWVTFTPTSVPLAPGAAADVELKVSLVACQGEQTFPFSVAVNSAGGGQPVNLSGQLVLDAKPQIMIDAPAENSLSGSDSVLFKWRTTPETSGSLSVYPAGNPGQALTFSTAAGTNHAVQVNGLARNTAYLWSVTATSECGSQTLTRHFSIGNGIVFLNHTQSMTIDRDYNQRMQVAVKNEDTDHAHTLTTSVLNSYTDLIVNFVDSGSADQTITLQPGETKQVTLAIHAQDTRLRNYELTAHLVADSDSTPIVDNAVLNVQVLSEGDYSIVEDESAFDPITLARTYIITNLGKPITDLSLTAVDPVTGLPANILLQPSLDHARLGTGESIRVAAYPIFTAENLAGNTSTGQPAPGVPALQTISFSPKKNSQPNSVNAIDYTLKGLGAGVPVNVSGSTSCPTGKQIYAVAISQCGMTFSNSDWYCTNRPSITTTMKTPAFLNQASIGSVSLGMAFAPQGNVLPHAGQVYFNGQQVGSFANSIPTGDFNFPIPGASWNSGLAGLVTQNIQISTLHTNGGHYVSSTGYHLNVFVKNATTFACAESQAAAQQAIQKTYACNAQVGFNPLTDVFNGSTWNWGEIKKQIKEIAGELGYQISAVNCTQSDCGDPINTRTGVFSFASPDISFPTSAGNLVFQRAYSSGTTDVYANLLGHGWTHNQAARLIFPLDPGGMQGYVLFKDFLGNQHLFKIEADPNNPGASGSYSPGPGVLATLTPESGGGGYLLTTPEQAQFEFDESGRLTARADAQGHAFEYTYDGEEKLTRVSADQGTRYIDLSYDNQGRIVSVSDYTGRQVTYAYDSAGDLVSSVDLLGRTWSYAYEIPAGGDSTHRMTQVLDPTGQETVTTEYDMNGRAYRQFDGNGKLMTRIVYNTDGSTTIYDGNSKPRTDEFDSRNVVTEKRDELNRVTDTTYDANFRPTEIENAAGHTLKMEWSADGRNLLAQTDPAGGRTVNTYDALNNLISTTDPLGNTTTYTYNGKLLTGKTNTAGQATTYTYTSDPNNPGASGWLETETDSYGRTTTYAYDAHGQRISVTDSYGRNTTYTYDALGRLIETTDPRGRVSRNEYDAAGQLLRSISNYNPALAQNAENVYNLVTTYEYDARGNQVAVTDTLGHVTRYLYDDADRLVKTTDALGNETRNTYDEAGHLIATTDALEHTTRYTYDAVGRRLTTIDALGQSSGTTTFNIPANTSTATDALGHSATYYYDALNRVVKVVDPLGNSSTTTYNANGNVLARVDQLGRTTRYEYDQLNRLARSVDPLGGISETEYDAAGNRVATVDPLGNRTTYLYSAQGFLLSTSDPLGHSTANIYDLNDNLIAVADPLGRTTRTEYDEWGRRAASIGAAGQRTTYTYDALDRVISTTDPTGTSTTSYDALGNVIARTDVHGRSSTSTYDALGRVVSTTDFSGKGTTNEYDEAGNLVSTTDAQGTTRYTYDALNRRIATTDPLGQTTRQAFDVLGNLTDKTDANGVVTHYEYDELNRQAAVIRNYRPGAQPDAGTNVRVDYTYNAVGNRTQVQDANGHVTEFQYDALNRVTRKTDPLGNTWQYEYDLAGNMVSRTDGNNQTTTFTYDEVGRLLTINYPEPDPDVSFTYDDAGQRTQMSDGLGTTTWSYDDLGRLVSATDPHDKTVSYTYDASGNRTGLTYPGGKQVAYTYDADNHLAEVADWSSHTAPESWREKTQYEYDALGHLLKVLRPNPNNPGAGAVDSSYTYDEAGRVTGLQHVRQGSPDPALAAYQYTYDPAGNIIQAVEKIASGETGPTVRVTVTDATGTALVGKTVYAFNGSAYTHYSKVTDDKGQASITLPEGAYRFRVDVDGTQFWSAEQNHCEIGKCGQVTLTIPQPVLVTVQDTDGTPKAGLKVYAFDGTTYTNFSGTTDSQGQVSLRLPQGSYRFRADFNGTQFWSGAENHCAVPGCSIAAVRVTVPVTVLVKDNLSTPKAGIKVYAFDGTTYTNYSATTGEDGQAVLTLPEGNYRFRADYNGTQFWSAAANHCSVVSTSSTQVPGCQAAEVVVTTPLLVTVMDTDGAPQGGVKVYAFNGSTYANFSATTDANGRASLTLPEGSYRFRADFNGTQFWSGAQNHCAVPDCNSASVTVTPSTLVTVTDTDNVPKAGLKVYVFNETTYTNFSGTTNADGQVNFTLPQGSYRFRADFTGTQFWSGAANHCVVPGCGSASVTVTKPLTVTVKDTDGTLKSGLKVYAFNGTTYTNYSGTTNASGQALFTLPQGSYRFRADLNGTQFWSGASNHCTLPGCEVADVTVSIPLVVNIQDGGGTPKAGVKVYAFNGATYTNYSATSDASGKVTLTLPLGSYRFRADYNGAQYWSGAANHCAVPGCLALTMTVGPQVTATPTATATHWVEPVETFTPTALPPIEPPTFTPIPTETATPEPTATEIIQPTETPVDTASATPLAYQPGGAKVFAISLPRDGFRAAPLRNNPQQAQTNQVTITVQDTDQSPKAGLKVYAFDGTTYAGFSGTTDANGQATLSLLQGGSYRFRADLDGTQFWSGQDNHCAIPDCASASITVTIPLTVTVQDTNGSAKAGLKVYAFTLTGTGDETRYTGYHGTTDGNGQLLLTLPQGSYRFRADLNGTQFWSGVENHCQVPGCASAAITVTLPVTVTVLDTDSAPKAGLKVYAFDETRYTGYHGATDGNGQLLLTLPQGSYRFRADLNGTQFWSGEQNHCAIPDCATVSITVTKPVTITVAGKTGQPYPNLPVYAFTGSGDETRYTGYHATTDANGKVTLTLPQGSYRFRADFDGVQFWSSSEDACVLPGCETAAVTLPGGTGASDITIDYAYDALNRLTSATYSNGTAFHYTYDAAGNVLEYRYMVNGESSTVTYTYDAANQLLTAAKDSLVWHYTYDGNGSLIQATPGDELAAGAKRYTYSAAGLLVKVETYTDDWQPQAEMAYDGLGNRLEMTGYADPNNPGAGGQSVTTQYALDNGRVLTATAGELTTTYLYGLGPIGELTTEWAYSLPDGANTPRQLVNAAGEVTLTSSYTPWGDTLSVSGTGSFTQGYLGGVMDTATGLLYVGNGQYYDPETGRFLNRNAKPEQNNPYTPWGDPSGALMAPLALLVLLYGRKKTRGKWDNLVIVAVLSLAVGMSLAACATTVDTPGGGTLTVAVAITSTGTPTVTVTATAPDGKTETRSYELTDIPDAPTETPTPKCPPPTGTPIGPTPTPLAKYKSELLSTYGVELLDGSTTDGAAMWNETTALGALTAVVDVSKRVGGVSTFRSTYHTYGQNLVLKKVGSYDYEGVQHKNGGVTRGTHLVEFAKITKPGTRFETMRNNIVHEMGHVFNNNHSGNPVTDLTDGPGKYKENRDLFLHDNLTVMWQADTLKTDSETFADMFLAYTYGVWREPISEKLRFEVYPNNPEYWDPPKWMDEHMQTWIGQ